ncbi:MAG: phosphate regulon transcriptional regulator PhoB [Burkholderiales bacterium]|jgi:two-component system phosphate regulon response regulator PhoB|nr:phosphate regulon transcriptional regulator PhoB [Burkholderiales bacterium]
MGKEAFCKTRVLIVEDQPDIIELLSIHLKHHDFDVVAALNGTEAQKVLDDALPDLILLDWMLPGGQDGIALARKWRSTPRTQHIPIIMLTARGEEVDKIKGLDMGVDDYVVKPFSPKELMARIRAVLRRRAPEQIADAVTMGDLTLDAAQLTVLFRQQKLSVVSTEFRLLHFLMKHPNVIWSRAALLDKVWGDHVFIEERTVDVHIKRLRQALGEAGSYIETVRGAGYRFSLTPQT